MIQRELLREVAEELGISERTVRRFVNGDNKETWKHTAARGEKIRRTLARKGYMPNAAARAMSTQKFNTVSMILSTEPHRSNVPQPFLKSLSRHLAANNMHLLVDTFTDKRLTTEMDPTLLRDLCCDGIFMHYQLHLPDGLEELAENSGLPVIWTNIKRRTNAVYPDDFAAGRRAVEDLLQRGHRRIAYVDIGYRSIESHGFLHYSKADRLNGCRAAMQGAGLKPQEVLPPPESRAGEADLTAQAALAEILCRDDRPTALMGYAGTDLLAAHLAATAAGLEIPADLSLVTFADGPQLIAGHPVAVMQVPQDELGRVAVESILARIAHPEQDLPAVSVPFRRLPANHLEG